MPSILPEALSSQVLYIPWASQGPRFFVPSTHYGELKRYVDAVKRKYDHTVVLVGVELCGQDGVMFGPEHDLPVDEEIVVKFGLTEANHRTIDQANVVAQPRKSAVQQSEPTEYMGRGRPAKYPFKSLRKIGDWFMYLEGDRHKLLCAGNNYLKEYLLVNSKFEYIRTAVGILVVMTACEDDAVSDRGETVRDK